MTPTQLQSSSVAINGLPSLTTINDLSTVRGMVAKTLQLTDTKVKPSVVFNGLLSVDEANNLFKERDVLTELLRPFMGDYERRFGISLLHRHTELQEDEVMVCYPPDVDGVIVIQPETIVNTGDPTLTYIRSSLDGALIQVYPSSWLVPLSQPPPDSPPTIFAIEYSFADDPVPETLARNFAALLGGLNVPTFDHQGLGMQVPILGICGCPPPLPSGQIYVEETRDRTNIVTITTVPSAPQPGEAAVSIVTLWTAVGVNCICTIALHSGQQLCNPCETEGRQYIPPGTTSTIAPRSLN